MKIILKIWHALNGSKTTIGMIVVLVAQGLEAYAEGFLTPKQISFLLNVGLAIGGGGLIHKGVKNEKINQALRRGLNK